MRAALAYGSKVGDLLALDGPTPQPVARAGLSAQVPSAVTSGQAKP